MVTLGTTPEVPHNTTVEIRKKIKIGKAKITCNFFLVFIYEDVDLESSTVSCNKGAGGKTAKVSMKTKEGFVFKGVVRPPNEIVKMEGGDFFADFYKNVSVETQPTKISGCGGYGVNIVGKKFPKGYTTSGTNLWENGVVEYSFVSDGSDSLKDAAFFVDAKVGYNQAEMEVIVKAMKIIEESF